MVQNNNWSEEYLTRKIAPVAPLINFPKYKCRKPTYIHMHRYILTHKDPHRHTHTDKHTRASKITHTDTRRQTGTDATHIQSYTEIETLRHT